MGQGTLQHFQTFLTADEKCRYIPFMLGHGGMPEHKGWHYLRLGTEGGIEAAIQHAHNVFPDAEIVEIWETTLMGDRIGETPAWKPDNPTHTVPEINDAT